MEEITRQIQRWLAKNNLPREGVKLVLEFPNANAMHRADMTIKREILPYMADHVTGGTFGEIQTMNGLGLSLRVAVTPRN